MLPIICLSNNALKLYIYNLQIKEIGSKEQVEDDALVRCDVQDSDELQHSSQIKTPRFIDAQSGSKRIYGAWCKKISYF